MRFFTKTWSIIYLFAIFNSVSFAQTAGPLVPMIYSTSGTGASWSNLSGVQLVDNNPAYVDLAYFPTCNNFMCYRSNIASFSGFGFSVPLAATITGVQLDIMQRVNSPGGGIHDSILTLAINGVAIGNNKANATNWLDVVQTQTYGGITDTWGNSLSPTDVNDNTFGILYEITNTSYDQAASVDFMNMTIHYQLGTSFFEQSSSPWFVSLNENSLLIKAQSSLTKGATLKLYDANGQLVFNQIYTSNNLQIDENISSSNWRAGLYLLHVENAQGLIFQKKLILTK